MSSFRKAKTLARSRAAEICTRDRVAKITSSVRKRRFARLRPNPGANLNGVDIIDHRKSPRLRSHRNALLRTPPRERRQRSRKPNRPSKIRSTSAIFSYAKAKPTARSQVRRTRRHTPSPPRSAASAYGQGFKIVSSFFLMVVPDKKFGAKGAMIYADCGVVVDPDVGELAEIAIASADSCRALLEVEPRVAMLSFSTKGSAKHKMIDKVVEATKTVKARVPDLAIDGELQADAALVQSVADSKAPGSHVARPSERPHLSRSQLRQHRIQTHRTPHRRNRDRPDPSGSRPSRATISLADAKPKTSSTPSRSRPCSRRRGNR